MSTSDQHQQNLKKMWEVDPFEDAENQRPNSLSATMQHNAFCKLDPEKLCAHYENYMSTKQHIICDFCGLHVPIQFAVAHYKKCLQTYERVFAVQESPEIPKEGSDHYFLMHFFLKNADKINIICLNF